MGNILNKAKEINLRNIKTIDTKGFQILLEELNSIDVILLFDVLHYFNKDERKKLYKNFHQILTKNAKLIIYPKHTKDNYPLWNLSNISNNDLQKEIEGNRFSFKKIYKTTLIHDDKLEKGNIFVFEKR